eukprot:1159369-Pelagomonas_calceolata.AAC.3
MLNSTDKRLDSAWMDLKCSFVTSVQDTDKESHSGSPSSAPPLIPCLQDLLLSKVRPSGQNCSSSSRRSSWHVMNMNAAELDSSLPYDDTAAEDRRASTASVRSSGGEEKGGVQGSKSKRRWSVGWQLQEQLQEQQEQPMQQLLHGHDSLAHPLREEVSMWQVAVILQDRDIQPRAYRHAG